MKKIASLTLTLAFLFIVGVGKSQTTITAQDSIAEQNLKNGVEFLAKNRTLEGVVELPSGLQYKILEKGSGLQPTSQYDTVTVHYRGTLIDGTQFDSSYDRNSPSSFALNRVIQGWGEGFQYLKEGTKAILYIPAHLAYGTRQRGEIILPNSVLIFEVELIQVSQAVTDQPNN